VKRWLTITLAWLGVTLVTLAVVGAAIVGPLFVAFDSWSPKPRPSDAVMIENLRQKRETFETLVKMIREDRGLKRVDVDWTDPADPTTIGVSEQRIALYRQLCREAGVPRGFYQFETSIQFIGYAAGMVVDGSSKSYVHGRSKYEPDAIDGDLDAAAGTQRKFHARRRIDGDWSLELMIN
jgi:hypothetical protein